MDRKVWTLVFLFLFVIYFAKYNLECQPCKSANVWLGPVFLKTVEKARSQVEKAKQFLASNGHKSKETTRTWVNSNSLSNAIYVN